MKHPDCLQILIALDQFVNTLLCGYADETLSSRAYRLGTSGKLKWPMRVINIIFFWQDNHCKESYKSEMERSQLPPALRGINNN